MVMLSLRNVDIVKDDIGGVCDEVIVLGRVPQHQVGNNTVVQAVDSEQNGAQCVDVGSIGIIPHLTIAINRSTCID